ncbi:MAG: glycerophosphodiester phosphodiesterase [Bacteroidetes bacterium]|nr:glycerophosphodiester phosphodiesterase [Bacteroidota bacterium]
MAYRYLILLFVLFSCKKVVYYKDSPLTGKSLAIAHRGGRTGLLRENTIYGSTEALKKTDGVEIDIQISKDGTIWLSHNVEVENCETTINCFPETRDAEIKTIQNCNKDELFYNRLEDLIAYMSTKYPDKYLIVDLKGWIPCSINSAGIEGMMRTEAEEVARLGNKYHFSSHILLESDLVSVLNWGKKTAPEMKTFLRVFGDLERGMLICLKEKVHGISFKLHADEQLTDDYIALLHKKGLQISVWNLNNTQELEYWQQKGVDYIQFDL